MAYLYPFASVYDAFTEDVGYKKKAQYIYSLFSDGGIDSGTVLDAACGTGSLTKEFLDMGFEAVAVDISPDMLSVAREKLEPCGDRVLLVCQDICALDLYGTVDCAVCALDSVNHLLTESDVCAAFKRIGLFLRPGGVFVFDVNTLFKHKNILGGNAFVRENDEVFLTWRNSECTDDGKIDIMLDIFMIGKDGKYARESESFSERAYSVEFLTQALKQSGFGNIKTYCGLSRKKAGKEDERVYFSAVKN